MQAVRSVVQPITHHLPPQVRDFGISLLGVSCYRELVLNVDLSNPDCVKLAVSKALGSGIVAVSAIVKLPQLYNLLQSQSASGVSFLSYLLETGAYLVTLAYNIRMGNPFSTFGENAFIAAQNVAITSLVLHYSKQTAGAVVFVAGLAASLYAMFNKELVDMNMMGMLQAGAGVMGVASKLPQIFTIWKEGGTGQLSSFAVRLLILA
jgi:mannose-P-dolichol utilization defect protein 1